MIVLGLKCIRKIVYIEIDYWCNTRRRKRLSISCMPQISRMIYWKSESTNLPKYWKVSLFNETSSLSILKLSIIYQLIQVCMLIFLWIFNKSKESKCILLIINPNQVTKCQQAEHDPFGIQNIAGLIIIKS